MATAEIAKERASYAAQLRSGMERVRKDLLSQGLRGAKLEAELARAREAGRNILRNQREIAVSRRAIEIQESRRTLAASIAGSAVTAAESFIDEATFGGARHVAAGLSGIGSAATGGGFGEGYRRSLEETGVEIEARETVDPGVALASRIGANFVPGTGPARLFRGIERVARGTRAAKGAAGIIESARLAKLHRAAPRIAAILSQSGVGVATGGVAAAASNALNAAGRAGDTPGATFGEAAGGALEAGFEGATDPIALTLSAVTGAASGSLRRARNAELTKRIERMERAGASGLRPSVDVVRDSKILSGMFSTLRHTPLTRRAALRAYDDEYLKPVVRGFRAIREKIIGARTAVQEKADLAAGVAPRELDERLADRATGTIRKYLGGKEIVGASGQGARAIEVSRSVGGLQEAVSKTAKDMLAAHGDQVVPTAMVVKVLAEIEKDLAHYFKAKTADPLSSGLMEQLQKLSFASKLVNAKGQAYPRVARHDLNVRDLWNLKVALDAISDVKRVAGAAPGALAGFEHDARIAGKASIHIRRLFHDLSDPVDEAVSEVARLKGLQRLSNQTAKLSMKLEDSEKIVDSWIAEPKLGARMAEMETMLPPGDVAYLRGSYLGRLLDHIGSEIERAAQGVKEVDPTIFGKTIVNMLKNPRGPYSARNVREVLGRNTLEYLEDVASMDRRYSAGLGAALGSPTASRAGDLFIAKRLSEMSAELIEHIPQPSQLGATARGAFHTALSAAFFSGATNSLLRAEGAWRQWLTRLATGEPVAGASARIAGLSTLPNRRIEYAAGAALENPQ